MFLRKYLPTFYTEASSSTLDEDIALFEKNWSALKSVDTKIGIASSIDAFLWLTTNGYITMFLKLALTVGIYLYVKEHANRNELAENFQLQLQKLVNHYRNYRGSDPKITNDPAFQKLLKTIAPFMSKDDLILWDLKQINLNDLSGEFIKTVMLDGLKPSTKPQTKYHAVMGLFAQGVEISKRTLYGYYEPKATEDQSPHVAPR